MSWPSWAGPDQTGAEPKRSRAGPVQWPICRALMAPPPSRVLKPRSRALRSLKQTGPAPGRAAVLARPASALGQSSPALPRFPCAGRGGALVALPRADSRHGPRAAAGKRQRSCTLERPCSCTLERPRPAPPRRSAAALARRRPPSPLPRATTPRRPTHPLVRRRAQNVAPDRRR